MDKRLNQSYLSYKNEHNKEEFEQLRKAQLSWIKYRDNWVKLIQTFSKNKEKVFYLKKELTKERIEDIEYKENY